MHMGRARGTKWGAISIRVVFNGELHGRGDITSRGGGGQKRPEKCPPRTRRRPRRRKSQREIRKPVGENDVTEPQLFQEWPGEPNV